MLLHSTLVSQKYKSTSVVHVVVIKKITAQYTEMVNLLILRLSCVCEVVVCCDMYLTIDGCRQIFDTLQIRLVTLRLLVASPFKFLSLFSTMWAYQRCHLCYKFYNWLEILGSYSSIPWEVIELIFYLYMLSEV